MARKSFVELEQGLVASFPDNVAGFITPQILRDYFIDFLHSIRPAYGVLQRTTPNAQALTTAWQPLVFEVGAVSDVPDYNVLPATGTITRLEAGSTNIVFNGAIEGPNGQLVALGLFKNGVATTWKGSATCAGAGNPVPLLLNALAYEGASTSYQFQVKSDSNASVTFSDLDCVAESLAVNAY
jgi:hypothetical protein